MDTTDRTDRLALPYLVSDQAQKHVTVNEGLRALDALVNAGVLSAALDAQPADPDAGDAYLMTAGRTGAAWSGFAEDDLAVFQDGAWARFAPALGMTVWVADEGAHRVWDGAAWVLTAAGGSAPTSAETFGVNAAADATNRLAVKSDAVLHSHDDASGQGTGDVRHVLNKADPSGTASFVFQTGYSGRAEIGLTGTDDFAFKVSADGVSFVDALTIDRATGAVSLPNTAPGGGVDQAAVTRTASAFTDRLEARLTARGLGGANPAKTKQVVMMTNTGKVQIGSAGEANRVEVYADGAALSAGQVTTRLFMDKGETAVLTGLSAGAVIVSSEGVCGVSENVASGGGGGPMPLGIEGFAAREFFIYCFRNSANGAGGVIVAAGPVPASVELRSGDGASVIDSVSLPAFGTARLDPGGDGERRIVADQDIFAAVGANIAPGAELYEDLRLAPPLSADLIGHTRKAFVSALYPNTEVRWFAQDGQSGTLTVSPGSPGQLDGITGGAVTAYEPHGFLRLKATGPISAYSGADGLGYAATPYMPVSTLSQRVPLPLTFGATDEAKEAGIAIASPYEGEARIYRTDGTLYATAVIGRGFATATRGDQDHPAAALVSNDSGVGGVVVGSDFGGGWLEADVPVHVVLNSNANETRGGGVLTDGDETAMLGVTPPETWAELREDGAGLLRRRTIDASGADSWVLC